MFPTDYSKFMDHTENNFSHIKKTLQSHHGVIAGLLNIIDVLEKRVSFLEKTNPYYKPD